SLKTSNNAFTVSKLPALPDRIRQDSSGTCSPIEAVNAHGLTCRVGRKHKRTDLFVFGICSGTDPSTCHGLALQLDIAVSRDLYLYPAIRLETFRSVARGMSRLPLRVVDRAWARCRHVRQWKSGFLGIDLQRGDLRVHQEGPFRSRVPDLR